MAMVVDRDLHRARDLADRYHARATTQVSAAFDCDVAIVATSTPSHHDTASVLIVAGMPVLVEKPLASTLADVAELIDAAEQRDTVLMCGFVERFNTSFAPVLELTRHGMTSFRTTRIGPPPARVHSGVVDDVLLHDLDLVLRCAAYDEVVDVRAQAEDWADGAPWPETVSCRLVFANGITAAMRASRVSRHRERSFTAVRGARSVRADLDDMTGNPLAGQFVHLVRLVRHSTQAERAAERRGILPPHELADRIGASIGLPTCTR